MKTEIFLFRHGLTLANEQKLYCGKTDVPLSEKGSEQLKKARAGNRAGERTSVSSYPDIAHCTIYTSGLRRANQTLRLLYPEYADSAIEEKAFREIDFGDFEMKSYADLRENPAYQRWVRGEVDRMRGTCPENPCPNGESWLQMNGRVLSALKAALKNNRSVALFTHGGVISAIMADFFPNERKSLYEFQPDFGAGYRITIEDDAPPSYEAIPNEKRGGEG